MLNKDIETVEPIKEADEKKDLLDRLKEATETKEPEASAASTSWSFDTQEETPRIQGNTPEKEKVEEKDCPKISKEVKLATASITVSALNSTQRVIFEPLIYKKYSKKFTKEEQKTLSDNNLPDQDKSAISPKDLPLRNKFDRLMKQCNKKVNAVPFTDKEELELEKIFIQYMDVKQKTLPPEIMLGISIINVLGKRAIDLFTE
ncbi:MAG: hypothetical protein JST67_08490 [Bacteroidetes bacterium]|nr:hypothetical protein [Bacteroidota bacterium]